MTESTEHLRRHHSSPEASGNAEHKDQDAPATGPGSLSGPGPAAPTAYPPTMIFAVNMFALYISIFCVALDNTIISTAIPQITDQFHALDDVGWYGSAYTLTQCAFILKFGKLYRLFNPKWVFLMSLFIFELGSLVCGVAPSSLALIFGRAIAGIGAAGLFGGVLVIITYTSPLDKRPIWQSLISGIFGIGSVVGPLMGGAFTDTLTWRWCFYINLPLGGVTAAIIVFFLRLTPQKSPFKDRTLLQKFLMFDPLGFLLFLPSIVCLFIALEWGGTKYPWSDGRMITLFLVFGVLLIAFLLLQWRLGETATIPPRIMGQRMIWSASWFAFFISGAFFLFVYFLPIYFQAIKGSTALRSGIDNLPLILAYVIVSIVSGFAVSRLGYINPFCLGSVVFASIGSGLLTTISIDTKTIGYQILFGIGSGLGFQQPPNAPQAVLPFQDLPVGIAITLFGRNFGSSLFVSVGNNMLDSNLLSGLKARAIPGVDPEAVLEAGATGFRSVVPASALPSVLDVYNRALQKTFEVGLIISCIAVIGAAAIEWKTVKGKRGPPASRPVENPTAEKAQRARC